MNKYSNTLFTALCSAMLVVFFVPVSVIAADSDSYRLYDDISNVVDPTPLGSTSFSLNEGGETWVAQPLSGSNFQIVTAPPAAVSSSSSSSEESSSSSEEEATGGSGGGGHRGSRTNEGGGSFKPSAPKDPIFPDLPGQISDQPDTVAEEDIADPVVEIGVPEFTTPTDSTNDVRRERRTVKPHFFDVTQLDTDTCECSGVHTASPDIQKILVPVPTVFQGPVASLMMLLIAFGLGYASKTFRPGHVQMISKKPKPRKTR
ncbi:MAG: hypothetical protein O3A80_03450 [bacterium]|nr:hypothetical protein [bacterium]MDA1292633.1 hypothetical protein [bacterium]